jgi:hypothetical protein
MADTRARLPSGSSLRNSFRRRPGSAGSAAHGEARRLETIPVARPYMVLFHAFAHQSHCDRAPATVGIRLGVVAEGIKMR